MDIGGLGHARDTLRGRMLSAVVFLSGRAVWPVGTVGPGMDDSSASLDNTRVGGARLYSQCKRNARGSGTYFRVAQEAGGTPLGSQRHHIRVTLLFPLLEEEYARVS